MPKAVALLSGGLDSALAVCLLKDQGIDVLAVHFTNIFSPCISLGEWTSRAKRVAAELCVPLRIVDRSDSMLAMVRSPLHGYGKNMNPCIDCRILTLREAKKIMEAEEASFLASGEVLGQRPMSQRGPVLKMIDEEAGVSGLVLRPLSARRLDITIPEKQGFVDRNLLLDLSGRSRKVQLALAQKYKLQQYSSPAGGCLLTDPSFGLRMRDLLAHGVPSLNDVNLCKVGRHLRLDAHTRLVLGRDESENPLVESLGQGTDLFLVTADIPGPTGLLRGTLDQRNQELAASITARYAMAPAGERCRVRVFSPGRAEEARIMEVLPIKPAAATEMLIAGKCK